MNNLTHSDIRVINSQIAEYLSCGYVVDRTTFKQISQDTGYAYKDIKNQYLDLVND